MPASDTWAGLYIDDKCISQVLPLCDVHECIGKYRDEELVRKGEEAYDATPGLTQATEKRVRFAESFTSWGTEVLGRSGLAHAPLRTGSRQHGMGICNSEPAR